MANINSSSSLLDYAKRKLGDPIVQINVTDDQYDDCIQQTFETWWINHPDGLEKIFLKRQVTGSKITVADSTGYTEGDTLINPKLTKAIIARVEGNVITIQNQLNPLGLDGKYFTIGEILLSENHHELSTTIVGIELGDMDNRWVPTSDLVYGVTRVMPFGGGSGGTTSSSRSMFDLQYQMRLNNMADLTSTSIAYYVEAMTHLSMLDASLNGPNIFRFNRLTNKLYVEAAWGSEVRVDDWIIAECYRAVDPTISKRANNEPWVRKYLIACIKAQWGINLKKYQGMQLVGGVTVDGQGLYDEGVQEMKDLEDDIIQNGSPLEWFVG